MDMEKPVNQLITDIYLLDIDDDAIIMTKKLNHLTEDFVEIIENVMDIKSALTFVYEYALKDDEKFARNFALLFTSKQILEYNGNVIRHELLRVLQNNYMVYAKKTFMMTIQLETGEYLELPSDDIEYYNSITLLGECYNRLRSNKNVPYEFMGNALFDLMTTKLKLILELYTKKPTETTVDVRFIKVILNQILLNGALAKSEHNDQIELLFQIIRRCLIKIIALTDMMKAFFMMTMELYYKDFKSLGNETEVFYANYLYDYEREFNHLKQYKISTNIGNLNHMPAMTTSTISTELENEIPQSNENVVEEMNLIKLKKEVDGFKRGLKKYVSHNKDADSSSSSSSSSADGSNSKKANKMYYPQKPLKLTDRLRFIQQNNQCLDANSNNCSNLNSNNNNIISDETEIVDTHNKSITNCNRIHVLENNDIIYSSSSIDDVSKNDCLHSNLKNKTDCDDNAEGGCITNNRITLPKTDINDYYVIKTVENIVNKNYNISSNENAGQQNILLNNQEMNIENQFIYEYKNKNDHTELESYENKNDIQLNDSINDNKKNYTEINSTNNKQQTDDHNKEHQEKLKSRQFSTLYSDRLTLEDRPEYYSSDNSDNNYNTDRMDYKSLTLRNKLPQYKKQHTTQRSFSSSSIPSPSTSKPNDQQKRLSNSNRNHYQQQNERKNSTNTHQNNSNNNNNHEINVSEFNFNYNNRNSNGQNNNNFNKIPNDKRGYTKNNNNNRKHFHINGIQNNITNNYYDYNSDTINNRSTSLQNN